MLKLHQPTSRLLAGAIAVSALVLNAFPLSNVQARSSRVNQTEILNAHNRYRQEIKTKKPLPNLKWSDEVARSAQKWADKLAANNSFEHSDGSPYGENLWQGTANSYSQTQMVDGWGDEKKDFVFGVFPNVSKTGNWADVGHYTQIIWRDTTEVGCGLATGGGNDVLVCQYNPPGNYQDEKPY